MEKKFYIQPQTVNVVCLPNSNVLLKGSESNLEPGKSPLRNFSGETQGLKYLI